MNNNRKTIEKVKQGKRYKRLISRIYKRKVTAMKQANKSALSRQ